MKALALISAVSIASLVAGTVVKAQDMPQRDPQRVSVGTNAAGAGLIRSLRDLGPAFAACWQPPREGDEITVQISFRRDGSVFGSPRITYMRANGGPDGQAELANSLAAAIKACNPMTLSNGLGALIAGRVFMIRLVAPRKERPA